MTISRPTHWLAAALLASVSVWATAAGAGTGGSIFDPAGDGHELQQAELPGGSGSTSGGSGGSAAWADEAAYADEADQADAAFHADRAERADHADAADHADSASEADTLSAGTCSPGDVLRKGEAGWDCVPETDLRPDLASTASEADSALHADEADAGGEAETLSPDLCGPDELLYKGADRWACVPAEELISAANALTGSIYHVEAQYPLGSQSELFATDCDDPYDLVIAGSCELLVQGERPERWNHGEVMALVAGGLRVLDGYPMDAVLPEEWGHAGFPAAWACKVLTPPDLLEQPPWLTESLEVRTHLTCLDVRQP